MPTSSTRRFGATRSGTVAPYAASSSARVGVAVIALVLTRPQSTCHGSRGEQCDGRSRGGGEAATVSSPCLAPRTLRSATVPRRGGHPLHLVAGGLPRDDQLRLGDLQRGDAAGSVDVGPQRPLRRDHL